jgi:hypothetical protein
MHCLHGEGEVLHGPALQASDVLLALRGTEPREEKVLFLQWLGEFVAEGILLI